MKLEPQLSKKWMLSQRVLSLVLLAVLPLLFLWRVAFGGAVLISLDMLLTYEPWRSEVPGALAFPLWNERMADSVRTFFPVATFIAQSWLNGEPPYWYPYASNGWPLLGASFFQAFYPINIIFVLLLPVHVAFGWSAIFHLVVGSLSMYFFMRELKVGRFGRIVGAVAYVYGSSTTLWLGVPFVLDTVMWLPLMFWGYEGALNRRDWRWGLLSVAGGLLQISAGMTQMAMYSFTGFGFYAMFRAIAVWHEKRKFKEVYPFIGYAALILFISCALSAYQLIPTLELVPQTIRSDVVFKVQTDPRSLIRLLIPEFWGLLMDGEVGPGFFDFEAYLYIGLLPLFLLAASLFSPQRRRAWSLFGVGLLFVMVIYNVPPSYQFFYNFFPTFAALGFLRSMFVITFVWAAAAGFGADWLINDRPIKVLRRLFWSGVAVGTIILIIALGLAFIAKYQARHFWGVPPLPDIKPNPIYFASTLLIFLAFLGAILALLWLWSKAKIVPWAFTALSILILVADLFLAHMDTTPALPESMLYPITPSLEFLQGQLATETGPYRISSTGRVLWPGTGGFFKIPSVTAHTMFPLKRYDDYANATGIRASTNFRVVTYQPRPSRLLDALNVKYIYATRAELAGNGWLSLLKDIGRPQVTSEQPAAGQVDFWNINNWTQPVLQAPAPSTISFLGPLPQVVTLETAIVIHPDNWQGEGALFEIYTGTLAEPLQNRLFSQSLTPLDHPDQRRWIPVTLTLASQPQEQTLVSFVTHPLGNRPTRAGWADPLIRPGNDFELLYYGPNNVYFNKNYLPRAWVVHQVTTVTLGDTKTAAARLQSPDFNPVTEAVVEGQLAVPLGSAHPTDTIDVQSYRVSEVTIKTQLAEPGLVVLSDIYYPGWKAYLDDREQPIYPTNLAMRGVFVEGGQHTLRFVYDPDSFRLGWLISLACLLTGLVALGIDARHRRLKRGTPLSLEGTQ